MIYEPSLETLHYKEFESKFKHKKTTDDCYTPPRIYDAVLSWCIAEYDLKDREIVRPFFPGMEYRAYDYPDDCVVIDNPPFSIIKSIADWYSAYNVDYFLFSPHLSNFQIRAANHVVVGAPIVYQNGADVKTSFITSLGEYKVCTPPSLYRAIMGVISSTKQSKNLTSYEYPDELITAAMIGAWASRGINYTVKKEQTAWVGNLDNQLKLKKKLFGGGYLIGNVDHKLECEKASKQYLEEKNVKTTITLTPNERALVESLKSAKMD